MKKCEFCEQDFDDKGERKVIHCNDCIDLYYAIKKWNESKKTRGLFIRFRSSLVKRG